MNMILNHSICGLALAAMLAPGVQAQSQPKLTARELFYTPVETASTPKPDQTRKNDPAPKTATNKNTTKNTTRPKDKTVSEAPYLDANKGKGSSSSPHISGGTNEVPIMNAAAETRGPLAIRYSVLKMDSDGDYQEVRPDTTFHSGDKIRVAIEANDAGYLYIVQRGSSKTWSVLFPTSDYEDGNNYIKAARRQVIPGKYRFTFDDTPGTERIFIVFSRKPEPDLEKLIYKLSNDEAGKGTPAKPASTPGETEKPKLMLAGARLDDPFVDSLRTRLVSRDLVFETVEDKPAAADKSEKKKDVAMYIATPDTSANARVVADVTLEHR
ncbi:MAG TPA: DUF4384 domain-containing protein [Bryobacteraceae bacterium]|nr:DUF4384 domain-containing protein [Bryobacteraceae bacterium]